MSMGERMTWKTFYMVEWGRNENMMFVWDLIDEEDLKRLSTWYSWNLDVFLSMLPSMLKGEIVSMNVDAIIMREHCRTLIWCNHGCFCHWRQHSIKFVKIDRVADCDLCIKDNILLIYWCIVVDVYYSMSWS